MVDEAAVPATTEEAVRRLLHARIDAAYRLATFILHDPLTAEDAVQEAALLAWDRRRTLRAAGSVDGWFTKILVNVCRDELRRRSRQPSLIALDATTGPQQATASRPPSQRVNTGLTGALSRVTPEEQVLLALRYGSDLTVPGIASQLGIPAGTVKSRLHAALEHLRAAIAAERRLEEAGR